MTTLHWHAARKDLGALAQQDRAPEQGIDQKAVRGYRQADFPAAGYDALR